MTPARPPRVATPAPHVALLRGINVGGRNRIAMGDLRDVLADLGFARVRTLLQSGNAVFDAAGTGVALERAIHDALRARLGVNLDVLVRDAAEWAQVIASNPFVEEASRDPSHLLVYFLDAAPAPRSVAALQGTTAGREQVRPGSRHAYVVYPDGIGRSRLTGAAVEKHLGGRATARNWNTVLKLSALVRE